MAEEKIREEASISRGGSSSNSTQPQRSQEDVRLLEERRFRLTKLFKQINIVKQKRGWLFE